MLAPDDPELALTLTGLGNVATWQGRRGDAEPLYREAQAIHQRNPESDWREAINEILLALFLTQNGEHEEPLALVGKALATYERVRREGGYWDPTIETLSMAGAVYQNAGDLRAAIDLYEQEVDSREAELGPDHPLVARSLMKLANLKRAVGLPEESRELFERALAFDLPALIEMEIMSNLSHTLEILSDLEGAYRYRLRVLEFREANTDQFRRPLLLNDRLRLAHLLMRLGRPTEARVHYRGAIELFRNEVEVVIDPPKPEQVQRRHELALLVARTGDREDALLLFEIALNTARECRVESERPALQAAIHRDWAELLHRMGRDDEAAEHEARAAELSAEAAGDSK